VAQLKTKAQKGKRYDILNSEIMENHYGDLEVFRKPEKGVNYIIGGDTAEGLAHGDSQIMVVINCVTEEIDAVYKSQITADEYPNLAIGLGKYYNNALLAIEANFEGRWINSAIVGMGYPNVYYRQAFDDITKSMTKTYGWLTSGGRSGTRGTALMSLKAIVLRPEERQFPLGLLEEMESFVMDSKGRPAALSGKHDDLIMASAIGYAVLFQQGKQIKGSEEQGSTSLMSTVWGESDVVIF